MTAHPPTAAVWPGSKFEATVDFDMLSDLKQRLERTRFPAEQAGRDWMTGTSLNYAKRLRDYWLNQFDWPQWIKRFNSFEQRLIEIEGLTVHVIVERGSGDAPLPLLMTNGWPGSFVEFIDIIDRLAHPERHGGRKEDSFTVIIPSLPGYGFSPAPKAPVSPHTIAECWSKLVCEVFGFDRYVAYGSDWGSIVTSKLAIDFPDRLRGVLLTSPGQVPYMAADAAPLSAEELDWRERAQRAMAPEIGYQILQGTKPQSLAFGHTDSPLALAAWIAEKHHGWSTAPGSEDDPPFSMDVLIANTMLYWINGALAPMWLYLFLADSSKPAPKPGKASVPASFLFSPHDLMPPPPKAWLDRTFDVARYTVTPTGGHFPGLDNPEALITELIECFGACR